MSKPPVIIPITDPLTEPKPSNLSFVVECSYGIEIMPGHEGRLVRIPVDE